MIKKQALFILLAIITLAVVGVGLCLYLKKPPVATNFEECTKVKGSIVLETYPRQCRTPDGKTFTEEVETSYYGEFFEGVLEFEEGIYYTKDEEEEKTEKEAFVYIKGLREKRIPIEKAWYFKSQTSCGMLQVIVPAKIVVKISKELPLYLPKNGEDLSDLLETEGFTLTTEVSQCASQSGWSFENFEDCLTKFGEQYPGTYQEGEMECYLSEEKCHCWAGTSKICIPQRHCIGD